MRERSGADSRPAMSSKPAGTSVVVDPCWIARISSRALEPLDADGEVGVDRSERVYRAPTVGEADRLDLGEGNAEVPQSPDLQQPHEIPRAVLLVPVRHPLRLVPGVLQPLIVAAAVVPNVEGEGAAVLGIIAGINPVVAAIAGTAGDILCVVPVVVLGSRIRGGVVARRAAVAGTRRTDVVLVAGAPLGESGVATSYANAAVADTGHGSPVDESGHPSAKATRRSKGRGKPGRWMVKFGVPGASILGPLALPTMLTAALFVASGVRKDWVILRQVVAIVLWTSVTAAAALGVLTMLGW